MGNQKRHGSYCIVRIENQNQKAENKLWHVGKKNLTNGMVCERVLNFLQKIEIVQNPENWDYSNSRTQEVRAMDEYKEADKCIYYVFHVKKHLIKF